MTTEPPPSTRLRFRHAMGPALVIVAIVCANAAYIFRLTDPDPLGPRGGVAASIEPSRLPGQRTIDPNNGFLTQAVGREAARQVVHGHAPLWNSFEGVGWPLVASPQSAALFPPTLLNLLPNGLFFETLLLECIAGLASYSLVRRLRVHPVAAVIVGVAFGLNGTFAWLQNGAMLPIAFVPLILLGVERAWERAATNRRGGWVTIAVASALAVIAGFPETVYISGFLIAVWTVWRFAVSAREHRARFVGKIVAGVSAGLLLAAPLILPFADYLRHADAGLHASGIGNRTLDVAALPTTFGLPYALGPIFAFGSQTGPIAQVWGNVGGFVSASVVLLMVVGLFGTRHRGLRFVLAGWIAVCAGKSFGPRFVVATVNLIPGMTSVAFYRYMTPSLELAAIVLSGLALDDILRHRVRRPLFVIAGAATLTWIWLAHRVAVNAAGHTPGVPRYLNLATFEAAAVVAVIVASAGWLRGRALPIAISAVIIADVLVMFAIPTLSAPRRVTVDAASAWWLGAHAGVQRYFTFGPIGPNYGSYFGIASAAANDVPLPKPWSRWLRRSLGPHVDAGAFAQRPASVRTLMAHPDLLRQLAVSFVLVSPGTPIDQPLKRSLTIVHRDRVAEVYRLSRARPYFDVSGGDCRVTPHGRRNVDLDCARPARLVRRELSYPGWTARVNGHPMPISTSGGLFEAVAVPSGRSKVTFTYEQARWRLALAACFLGTFWIVAALLRRAFVP